MKKFHFSLETLLEVRRSQENLAYKELLDAQMMLSKTVHALEELEQESLELKNAMLQTNASSANTLANQYEYFHALSTRIQNQKNIIKVAQDVLEKQRKELANIIQKRKVIENLQERKYARWDYAFKEQERAFFDDLATMRFLTKAIKHS